MKACKLALVSSHPIQYNAPLFRELAQRPEIDLKVFYSWAGTADQPDPEFGTRVDWDIPLCEGYGWEMVPNVSKDPGTHHYWGLDNPEMITRIQAFNPDALLVYGWSSQTHLRVLRHFSGKLPVLFRGDSTLVSGVGKLRGLVRLRVLRWIYRNVDIALYPGVWSRAYFSACGLKDPQLSWMPHSIDNKRFGEDSGIGDAEVEAERQKIGITKDDVVFLFAGKFVQRKQSLVLLQTFFKLTQGKSKFHLILAGAGPQESELRRLSEAYQNVHFPGFTNQSDMPMIYRLGDVFVLPSSRETWGLAVNEAMASGRTILVSDKVGCMPNLALNKPYAEVFECGSEMSLLKAMRRFGEDRAILAERGVLAAKEIQSWSIENAADALSDALARKTRELSP